MNKREKRGVLAGQGLEQIEDQEVAEEDDIEEETDEEEEEEDPFFTNLNPKPGESVH